MGNSGCTLSCPQATRVRKAAKPRQSCVIRSASKSNGRFTDSFDLRVHRQSSNAVQVNTTATIGRVHNVRPPTHAMMTEHSSQDELNIKYEDRQQGQSEEAWAAGCRPPREELLQPILSREKGDSDCDTEKCLRNSRVSGRDCRRLQETEQSSHPKWLARSRFRERRGRASAARSGAQPARSRSRSPASG